MRAIDVSAAALVIGAFVVAADVHVARAQTPSATELSAARELFETGIAAARAERWVDAREAFARSFAIVALPGTRLNLAGAQVQTGQLVAGAESYRAFLDEATTGRITRLRPDAERALAAVEARIPRVRLTVIGLLRGDVIMLHGRPIARAALSVPLRLDPGPHPIEVLRNRVVVASTVVTLAERVQRDVRLRITPPDETTNPSDAAQPPRHIPRAATPRIVPPREDDDDRNRDPPSRPHDDRDDGGSSVLESPWLWLGVGIAIAGGVTVAVVASSSGSPELTRGTFGPGMVTFE